MKFAASLFFLMATLLSLQADTILLRADEWCPFNCAPDSKKPGFMIEIAQEVFAKEGHEVFYETTPWSRALREAQAGKIHGVVGAAAEEAQKYGLATPEVGQGYADDAFFVNRGEPWRYSGPQSLEKMVVAIIKDYTYDSELDPYLTKYITNPTKVQVVAGEEALELNFKKLLLGRVDVVIETGSVGLYKLREMGLSEKVEIVGSIAPEEIYIAFGGEQTQAKELAKILSDGTEQLRKNGHLDEILASYGVKDWK